MNLFFQIFGYIGSSLLSVLLIPQVHKTRTTKEVNGLSIQWLFCNLFTCVCWIIYAIGFFFEQNYLDGGIIMFANSCVMFFNCMLIYYYFKYK